MRQETENRLWRAVVLHRPHFEWSSPKKRASKPGHISSLSVEQLLKTKVAIRAIPSTRPYEDGPSYVSNGYEYAPRKVIAAAPGEKKHRGPKVVPGPYQIPRTEVAKSKPRTCNSCPHPGRSCSFEQYTIPNLQPPTPPRRSSSLPIEVRVAEANTRPSAPLSPFVLTTKDGYIFQYLVIGPLTKLDHFSRSGLWPNFLQICHTVPCIRHVVLGIAITHQLRTKYPKSQNEELDRYAVWHYARAVKLLRELLTTTNRGFDGEDWEVMLCATLLFTTFAVMRRNDECARWWMDKVPMLLRHASNARDSSTYLVRNVKQFELGFRDLDLNLRAKRMRARKKDERKMGKCGAGVLRRRERKAARLSLSAYANCRGSHL